MFDSILFCLSLFSSWVLMLLSAFVSILLDKKEWVEREGIDDFIDNWLSWSLLYFFVETKRFKQAILITEVELDLRVIIYEDL